MTARRGHLAAVPGEGQRGPEEEVRERPRFLAGVGTCQHPGCDADVQELATVYGPVMFDARPVPLTGQLLDAGDAYVMVRHPNATVIVNAKLLPADMLAPVETALTPHVHTSHDLNAAG